MPKSRDLGVPIRVFLKDQFTTAQVGEVERRRREDRGAEGAEEARCGEGVSPSPPGRGCAPSPEKFLILALNMVSFGAFWMVFFTVQLPILHAKPV